MEETVNFPQERLFLAIIGSLMILSNFEFSMISWRVVQEHLTLILGASSLTNSLAFLIQAMMSSMIIAGILVLLHVTLGRHYKSFGKHLINKSLLLATISLALSLLFMLLTPLMGWLLLECVKYASIQLVSYAGLITYQAFTFRP